MSTTKRTETTEQMAAIARLALLNGRVDSKGRRLPLRYWAALSQVEGR